MRDEDIKYIHELEKRVQELEDILDQDRRQEVLESMYEENKRYREALKNAKYAIHTQISSINHQENTESKKWYIRGMTFSMDMINKYFDEALEDESK